MNAATQLARKIYRALLPEGVRQSSAVAHLKSRILGHDWEYTAEYYARTVEGPAVRAAGTIADSIVNDFTAGSAVDVGCGTGALLAALRERKVETFGLEYAEAALDYCRTRQLTVEKFDLERGVHRAARTFDVAISLEVAEHLPAAVANRYVDLLTRLAPAVVFTAAPPGQEGMDHVNEQPPSYWIAKFRDRGFDLAEERTARWREDWQKSGDVADWYYRNLMIFERRRDG